MVLSRGVYCIMDKESDVRVERELGGLSPMLKCESCMNNGEFPRAWRTANIGELIEHLEKHLDRGHLVPQHVIATLREEASKSR